MNVGEGLIAFDLALGASSRSRKRVHVRLRSLECCAFRLACEALIEREIFVELAPHQTGADDVA